MTAAFLVHSFVASPNINDSNPDATVQHTFTQLTEITLGSILIRDITSSITRSKPQRH